MEDSLLGRYDKLFDTWSHACNFPLEIRSEIFFDLFQTSVLPTFERTHNSRATHGPGRTKWMRVPIAAPQTGSWRIQDDLRKKVIDFGN